MRWAEVELAGWGRAPVVRSEAIRPERRRDAVDGVRACAADGVPVAAHGLGRSYGDSALIRGGRALITTRLDRVLAFDGATGIVQVEAGVSLGELLSLFVPRGWFLPVVPGTRHVTVGGAIASDIHGKNHHVDGSFGAHVLEIELLTGTGEILRLSRREQPALFEATIGGMGLTGIVLTARLRLRAVANEWMDVETIRVANLDEFFEVSSESAGYTHTVSWVDCLARGAALGRGLFMRGRHTAVGDGRQPSRVAQAVRAAVQRVDLSPLESNVWLNGATMRAFNEVYYHRQLRRRVANRQHYEPFFFPLDVAQGWNRLYGSRGMLQYQVVVPEREAVRELLEAVSASGMASFLAVIKEFGPATGRHLSFPRPGVTLALDFPHAGAPLLSLLERLDAMTVAAGGRAYLAKDARMSRATFRAMYPEWEAWRALRDASDPRGVFATAQGLRLGLCGEREVSVG